MGSDGVDWIYRAQDRKKKVGGPCEHGNVIRDSRKLRGIHRNIYCTHYSIFGSYDKHNTARLKYQSDFIVPYISDLNVSIIIVTDNVL